MAAADLTAARLRELLHYDPDTGVFTWLKHRLRTAVGKPAGTRQKIGYIVIRVDGRLLYAHRLAWLYVTWRHPAETIDHRDGQKDNNRWNNLRDVPQAVNSANHHKAQGSAGLLGVARNRRTGNWRAIITRGNKQIHIGTFTTPEEAHQAYLAEWRRLEASR